MLWYQQNYKIHGEKKNYKKISFSRKKKLQKIIDRHWDLREGERNRVGTDRNRKWEEKLMLK